MGFCTHNTRYQFYSRLPLDQDVPISRLVFVAAAVCAYFVLLGTWTSRWRELKDTFFEGMIENSQGNNQRGSSDDHGGMLEDGLRDPMEMNDLEVQK